MQNLSHLPKDSVKVDLSIIRGFDYYTGTILEAYLKGTTFGAVGSGGRYDDLASVPLALCTNKSRRVAGPLLDALDLTRRFRVIVAGDDLPRRKPDPLPLLHIAERLGVPASTLVMVGDGVQDIQAGRAAGAFTVAVLGGFTSREALAAERPDRVVEGLDGVIGLVGPAREPEDSTRSHCVGNESR
jgi:phosphoglycolate phosphatase